MGKNLIFKEVKLWKNVNVAAVQHRVSVNAAVIKSPRAVLLAL